MYRPVLSRKMLERSSCPEPALASSFPVRLDKERGKEGKGRGYGQAASTTSREEEKGEGAYSEDK